MIKNPNFSSRVVIVYRSTKFRHVHNTLDNKENMGWVMNAHLFTIFAHICVTICTSVPRPIDVVHATIAQRSGMLNMREVISVTLSVSITIPILASWDSVNRSDERSRALNWPVYWSRNLDKDMHGIMKSERNDLAVLTEVVGRRRLRRTRGTLISNTDN